MHHEPRILIVEDQYLVAIDCEAALSGHGFTCVGLANTAQHAIELVEREHPDLVLMDIRLDGRRDGVDAAIEIYRRFGVRSLFTSGHVDSTVRRRAEAAHPAGWLDKPYSSAALVDAVLTALKTSEPTAPRDVRPPSQPISLR